MTASMSKGLVAELAEAVRGFVLSCRCRGTGHYLTDCTLCGDSTYDHMCNDREVPCEKPLCVAARRALARATPEAVAKADAAPEMCVALIKAHSFLTSRYLGAVWADQESADVGNAITVALSKAQRATA